MKIVSILTLAVIPMVFLIGCEISPGMFLQNPVVAGLLVVIVVYFMWKYRRK